MLVIGEKINASIKSVAEAIASKNTKFIEDLARAQAEAGADFIDVNAGAGEGAREHGAENMEWLVEVVQATTDKPLTIDSDVPDIIRAALRKCRGEKVMINSVTAEPERLNSIGPLAAEHQASLVALAMGTKGIPDNVEDRLAACDLIMTHLTGLGMAPEQIFFDPLVLPIAVDSKQGLITLKTIQQIKKRYPTAKIAMGLSNISYGLPNRKLINRGFLLMAAYAGLDAAILDPLDTKIMSMVKVSDLLTGNDSFCKGFIKAHRQGSIME